MKHRAPSNGWLCVWKSWIYSEDIINKGNSQESNTLDSRCINFSIHLHMVHVEKIWFLWWLKKPEGRLSLRSNRGRCQRRWRASGRRTWGSVLLLMRSWMCGRVEVIAIWTNIFLKANVTISIITSKVKQPTSIFPHTLFNKSIVSETFFTDQGIARTWGLGGNIGIVVAQDPVNE